MLTHSHARALDIAKDKMLDIAKVHMKRYSFCVYLSCPHFFLLPLFPFLCVCLCDVFACVVCVSVCCMFPPPCSLLFQLAVVRVCCRMFVVVVLVLRLSFITLPSHLLLFSS